MPGAFADWFCARIFVFFIFNGQKNWWEKTRKSRVKFQLLGTFSWDLWGGGDICLELGEICCRSRNGWLELAPVSIRRPLQLSLSTCFLPGHPRSKKFCRKWRCWNGFFLLSLEGQEYTVHTYLRSWLLWICRIQADASKVASLLNPRCNISHEVVGWELLAARCSLDSHGRHIWCWWVGRANTSRGYQNITNSKKGLAIQANPLRECSHSVATGPSTSSMPWLHI